MKRWLPVILFLLALGGAIGWRIQTKVAASSQLGKQTAQRKSAASNVVMATAKSGDILKHVDVVGNVETPFDIKLAPKVAGVVDYLEVRSGDEVKANQVLVRINPLEQQAQVDQMRSALAEAKQRYTQALLTQNPNNTQVQTQIGQNTAQVASAKANENQVTENYNAQVQSAQAAVTDADSKLASAKAQKRVADQAIVSARANFQDANAKYQRTNTLYEQGYIAAQSVDDAKAALAVAQATVDSASESDNAAQSAVDSAAAQLKSAQQQLLIVQRQGRANIVAAKASTHQAEEALRYSRSNTAQIAAYKANLAALKDEVSAAQAQLDNAVAVVGDTTLKTPFDGTVTSRLIDPGSMASVGQQLLEVQYLNWLFVVCSAPIEDSAAVKVGQIASLSFDSLPGQTFSAAISSVTPAADLTSRQFTFRMKLKNPKRIFKPGMYAHVDVVTTRIHANVLVPREAVTTTEAGSTVLVVDSDSVAHLHNVEIGASDPSNIEITNGLSPGDKVIVLSYMPIKDGTKVDSTVGQGGQKGSAS